MDIVAEFRKAEVKLAFEDARKSFFGLWDKMAQDGVPDWRFLPAAQDAMADITGKRSDAVLETLFNEWKRSRE